MRQQGNMITTSRLRRRSNYNSVTDTGISPDQLGVNITKSVFGWKTLPSGKKAPNGGDMGTNTAASNWIDQYGMPFIFVIGGNQILLPPVVQAGGAAVPYLPDGLQIVWASSFMNVSIPADMLNINCAGGKLTILPLEIYSARTLFPTMSPNAFGPPGSQGQWTNNVLIGGGITTAPNGGETLLMLMMAALECLIYSYSSYPWGNKYNDLAQAITQNRNLSNFLVYPYSKSTFLQNIVSDVTPIYTRYVAPVLGVAAGAVTGGVGTAVIAASVAGLNAANKSLNSGPGNSPSVNTALTTQEVPAGTILQDQGGQVVASGGNGSSGVLSSPIIIIGIIILIIFLIKHK